MKGLIKQGGSSLAVWSLLILVGILCLFGNGIIVHAEENPFDIEAVLLPTNTDTYDIQLSINNVGADWEGTVRLMVNEEYSSPSAYDTVISLPQGSKKQFVVKVPMDSVQDSNCTVKVSLWKNSKKVAEKKFTRLLRGEVDALAMGILSDDYSTLTYLDMGGEELYFHDNEYPIQLVELSQGGITDVLETLKFLVIDTYNTEVLTEEELDAIEQWNYDGGVLIVGTGNYAEDTLKGLGDNYLKIECREVDPPEEAGQAKYDYVDWSQLHMAELRSTSGQYMEHYLSDALITSVGDGSIGVLPYALTEVAEMDNSFYMGMEREYFVLNVLDEISSAANYRYNGSTYYHNNGANMISRMLRVIGNSNSSLQFGTLTVIVIVYVIFVGPVLYLILRFLKKRELYWVTVPVSALLGIVLIFFAGRGFEIVDTRVYSVTAEKLSGTGGSKTYLYCFDANHKEWDLKLSEGYEYVGALDNSYYFKDDDEYFHHIKKEGETFFFGINPTSSFEDSYFYAGKNGEKKETAGSIESVGIQSSVTGAEGTISNRTGQNFIYYAVIVDDTLYIYENLPAGETSNLSEQIPVYSSTQGYDIWSDYCYDFLMDVRDREEEETIRAVAALGVGLCSVYPQNDAGVVAVMGVTENWDKTVDDTCSEISYGCLYTVQ